MAVGPDTVMGKKSSLCYLTETRFLVITDNKRTDKTIYEIQLAATQNEVIASRRAF